MVMKTDDVVINTSQKSDIALNQMLEQCIKESNKLFKDLKNKSSVDIRTFYRADETRGRDTLEQLRIYMMCIICIINGVSYSQYVFDDENTKVLNPFNAQFNMDSLFFNYRMNERFFKLDSREFKVRFTTLLLTHYLSFLDKYMTDYLDTNPKARGELVGASISENVLRFTLSLLTDRPYGEYMNNIIYQLMANEMNPDAAKSHMKEYLEILELVEDGNKNVRRVLSKIMKNTFSLMTNTRRKFKPDLNVKDFTEDDIMLTISMLGDALMCHKENDGTFSPLYTAWEKANGRVETRFKHCSDIPNLANGCRALRFWAYVHDNPDLSRLVDGLIK